MRCLQSLALVSLASFPFVHGHGHHGQHHHHAHDGHHDHVKEEKDRDLFSLGLGSIFGSIFGGSASDSVRCDTRDPDDTDLQSLQRAVSFKRFKEARRGALRQQQIRTVQVCFHAPQFRRNFLSFGGLTNEQLQIELDHLNEAFSASSCCDTNLDWCNPGDCSVETEIRFEMALVDDNDNIIGSSASTSDPNACITRKKGRRWMRTRLLLRFLKTRRIKRRLHVGDANTLNLYYIRSFGPGRLLGFASFPWEYEADPTQDGVFVDPETVLGGNTDGYNQGDTTVHEVGHWLGLFHTFEGGCSPGDSIDDTAPQSEQSSGCPVDNIPDTCGGDDLPDNIFNFMDYSSDTCLYLFTAGQSEAMAAAYDMYRSPDSSQVRHPIGISESADGPPPVYSLEAGRTKVFTRPIETDASVTCTVEATSGDMDLFMNWSGDFDEFDCSSETEGEVAESCFVSPGSGELFVVVHAVTDVTGMTLSCTSS